MFGNNIIKAASVICIGLIAAAGTLAAEEIPWPLAEDYSRDSRRIDEYIKSLGTTTNSKVVGEFRKKLRARVEEDKKIVAAGSKHPRYEQAKEELDRYDVFLGRMGQARRCERDGLAVRQHHDGERRFASVERDERRERVGRFPLERVLDA